MRLCYGDGLKIKDAATREGRTPAATYKALARVREELQVCVQEKLTQADS